MSEPTTRSTVLDRSDGRRVARPRRSTLASRPLFVSATCGACRALPDVDLAATLCLWRQSKSCNPTIVPSQACAGQCQRSTSSRTMKHVGPRPRIVARGLSRSRPRRRSERIRCFDAATDRRRRVGSRHAPPGASKARRRPCSPRRRGRRRPVGRLGRFSSFWNLFAGEADLSYGRSQKMCHESRWLHTEGLMRRREAEHGRNKDHDRVSLWAWI